MTGSFKSRFNGNEVEFKIDKMMLLESVKPLLTKQVVVDMEARYLKNEMIGFLEKNMKEHPGKSGLKFNLIEPRNLLRVSLYTMETGFEMNDELAAFLLGSPELDVQVLCA